MNKKQNKRNGELYRGMNEYKVYQPKNNLVKDENADLLDNSHNILNIWKNYFCQLLNYMVSTMLGTLKYIQMSQ
jgi:hypothetical protein